MIPPMGQAALGIQIISSNDKIREIASIVNDPNTFLCTKIERDFISKIGAGCSAPVACNATIENEIVTIRTMIGYPDGTNIVQKSLSASIDSSENLGKQLADEMIKDGIMNILKDAEKIAFKDEMPQRI